MVFKEKPAKKLTERYVGSYIVEKVVSKNVANLKLSASIRIYLVVDISKIVRYRKLVKKTEGEETKTS